MSQILTENDMVKTVLVRKPITKNKTIVHPRKVRGIFWGAQHL